jgi:hypothetical protein
MQSRRRVALFVLAATVTIAIAAASAEPLNSIPNPRTRDGTWVTDMAGMLRPETIAQLNTSTVRR